MPVETSPDPESLAEETIVVEGPAPVKGGVDAAGVTATADELEQVLSPAVAEPTQDKSKVWKILLGCLLALMLLCCGLCIAGFLIYSG